MTAQRWWVKLAARWLARIDGVSGQFRLAFLAVTGVSTTLVALRDYGYGQYAPLFVGASAVAAAVFAYLYTEGGVWNQVARDRQDMSGNFSDPKARINTEMTARSLHAAMQGRELRPEEREAIKGELDATFAEHRDGINLEQMDD